MIKDINPIVKDKAMIKIDLLGGILYTIRHEKDQFRRVQYL
jgi:hypothetical protein